MSEANLTGERPERTGRAQAARRVRQPNAGRRPTRALAGSGAGTRPVPIRVASASVHDVGSGSSRIASMVARAKVSARGAGVWSHPRSSSCTTFSTAHTAR